ncbi:MAG: hypothetical protein ABEH78_06075 [Haloferacaceae archaeon]
MVTRRYDEGGGGRAEITAADFEYVPEGEYWIVVVEREGPEGTVKWIPRERIYEIEGRRGRIRDRGEW